MPFEVVHADGRYFERESQCGRNARAYQQRACQPRSLGVGDPFDILQGAAGFRGYLAGERQDAADMVARGQFRHHAAIFGVHCYL